MRTIARILINLALIVAALAVDYGLVTQKAYLHASRDARIAMLAAPAVAAFVLACIVLHFVPAKKRPSPRPSFTYAAPAKRGR